MPPTPMDVSGSFNFTIVKKGMEKEIKRRQRDHASTSTFGQCVMPPRPLAHVKQSTHVEVFKQCIRAAQVRDAAERVYYLLSVADIRDVLVLPDVEAEQKEKGMANDMSVSQGVMLSSVEALISLITL